MHTAKIDGSENASNGRLQEFKNNGKLLIVRPDGDGRLPEVQTVRLWRGKIGVLDWRSLNYRRWSLTRSGRTWSFDCTRGGKRSKSSLRQGKVKWRSFWVLLSVSISLPSPTFYCMFTCLPYFSALVVREAHKAKHRLYYILNVNYCSNSSLTLQTAAFWTGPAMHCPFTSEISVKRERGISILVMRYFYTLMSVQIRA